MTLILNTLIYAADHDAKVSQKVMVEHIATLGADGVELRREYFTNIATELSETVQLAHERGLTVNYSVPDVLFLPNGTFNPKIPKYYAEAQATGMAKIKFNIGNFAAFTGDIAKTLGPLVAKVETNVENDQSVVSGTLPPLLTFLVEAKQAGLDIQYVYDMGNWAFVNTDAHTAARELAPYTRYIHLKNTAVVAGRLATPDDLEHGLYDWRQLVQALPHGVQYALEYPMADDDQVAKQMQLVRNVIGTH